MNRDDVYESIDSDALLDRMDNLLLIMDRAGVDPNDVVLITSGSDSDGTPAVRLTLTDGRAIIVMLPSIQFNPLFDTSNVVDMWNVFRERTPTTHANAVTVTGGKIAKIPNTHKKQPDSTRFLRVVNHTDVGEGSLIQDKPRLLRNSILKKEGGPCLMEKS